MLFLQNSELDRSMNKRINGRMQACVDGQIVDRTDGWMASQIEKCLKKSFEVQRAGRVTNQKKQQKNKQSLFQNPKNGSLAGIRVEATTTSKPPWQIWCVLQNAI